MSRQRKFTTQAAQTRPIQRKHAGEIDIGSPVQKGMNVRMLQNGSKVTGLSVGVRNVRRYFAKHIMGIELQLDQVWIECQLQSDFWYGDPRSTILG